MDRERGGGVLEPTVAHGLVVGTIEEIDEAGGSCLDGGLEARDAGETGVRPRGANRSIQPT